MSLNVFFYLLKLVIKLKIFFPDSGESDAGWLRTKQMFGPSHGARYLMGENLEVVWAEFSTLS